MNPHERQIIDDLFDKLRDAEQQSGPREPIAEAHIRVPCPAAAWGALLHGADHSDAGAGAADRSGAHRRA